ncbi:PA14 domain-containing protein [Hymenobacter aerilatus]|uniref:PA14 domain-containing protein n=1 Tax=Hymenobacter aerilatus TaxID=2932251 RepID=A0A8T9SXN6_9BACT|nr:PA14 domain-containing protein [Hymenobacter aerilatus]UOR04566.1 PA14 domain-containing protein [Hymenobacter aerilatus]
MPPTVGTGLQGQYYVGREFDKLVLTRLDPTIDFNWSYGPPTPGRTSERFVSPGPGVPGEVFSARWTGYLYAPVSGTYTLHITTDDGMRVWLGNRLLLDGWHDQWVTTYATRICLTAGRYYPLRLEYYQVHFDTRALLAWQTPPLTAPSAWDKLLAAVGLDDTDPAPIPTRYLYPPRPAASPRPTPPAPVVAAALSALPSAPVPKAARVIPPRLAQPTMRRRSRPQPLAALRPQTTTTDTATPPPTLPTLRTLTKGETLTLPNLYFTRSTAALLPTSYPTLNTLARTLQQQPALRLTIAGHTDNVGDAQLNQRLSEQRARVVRRYLVQQGIDSLRLAAVGYGGTRPVADNHDPRQRPRNRRVEVIVE